MAKKKKKAAGKKKAAKEVEVLLVASKVREAIRGRGFRMSGEAITGLNMWVHWLVQSACNRCEANGRQTVKDHDFYAG